ncbi:MAG: metallophosphoesterase [Planctomycetota bacterium]
MKKPTVACFVLVLIATGAVPAEVRKGPYLLYPGNNTQMTVLWQLDSTQTCTLEWGLDTSYSDGNIITVEYGTDHQHKHIITGLNPGGMYYYRLIVDSNEYPGSFRAAPPDDAREVKFLGYGDTRTGVDIHDMVDAAMVAAFEQDPNYQTFTMLSGDWVDDGEKEGDWTNEFFNPTALNTRELQANLPINGCIGNHEYEDDSTPHTFFDKYWPYPYVDGYYWSFDYGPAHITVLDQEAEDYLPGSAQYNWLVNDLASTTKEWKILQFHKPGYSAGNHDDEVDVQDWIQPLCEQYGVDIVFAGHNHYYARCIKNGIIHITAGGGGAPLRDGSLDYSEYVEVYEKAYHFCKVHIRGNELDFDAVEPDGTVIDSFAIFHPTIELIGPADGAAVGAKGAAFSCQPVPEAVRYQLLFGPSPDHTDYLISDTPNPPTDTVREFPFAQTWWTIRVSNEYGRYFYAEPRHIATSNARPVIIENLTAGTEYHHIQDAIDEANDEDEIVIGPGIWQYLENINFKGKNLTLRSTNPSDPAVVAATVINGAGRRPAVTFATGEHPTCVLAGLTITGGTTGIRCVDAWPTITNCRVVANSGAGIESDFVILSFNSARIVNCDICGNGGDGLWARGRIAPSLTNCLLAGNNNAGIDAQQMPIITNCTIVDNAMSGVVSLNGIIGNCIVWGNGPPQVVNNGPIASTTYSNAQGGLPGLGNISTDPCFVRPGQRGSNGLWIEGNYHPRQTSSCIDKGRNLNIPADSTDLDGDANTTELVPWDLDRIPRLIDGDSDGNSVVDMGAYEFWPPIEVPVKFTPQALNPTSSGNWVKAHLILPEEFTVEDVDANKPAVLEPPGTESESMKILINDDGLVEIIAAFARADLCRAAPADDVTEIRVAAYFATGRQFCGIQNVKITKSSLEYLAGLASHWLEEGCDKADWCDGLDLDQNSVVNFTDFAIFDGCCIGIITE